MNDGDIPGKKNDAAARRVVNEEEEEEDYYDNGATRSGTSSSVSGEAGGNRGGGSDAAGDGLASHENRLVYKLRRLVLAVILVAAFAVTTGIYALTRIGEREEFRQQFEGAALKVISSFEGIAGQNLAAMAGLSLQASLYAESHNLTWPFVTMPKFHKQAALARRLSEVVFTRLAPLVNEADRELWEEYSVQNAWWLRVDPFVGFNGRLKPDGSEPLEVTVNDDGTINTSTGTIEKAESTTQKSSSSLEGDNYQTELVNSTIGGLDYSSGVADRIWEFGSDGPAIRRNRSFHFPLWQESPTFGQDVTNWDMTDYPPFRDFVFQCHATQDMVMGGIQTAPVGGVDSPDLITAYYAYMLSVKANKFVTYIGQPMSTFFLPVFRDFDEIRESDGRRDMVALIFAIMEWGVYFEDLLPPNFPGLNVILENSCGQSFTYRITGVDVAPVGEGDRHDHRYDGWLEMHAPLRQVEQEGDSVFGLKLNQDLCAYEMHVYPAPALEDEYITILPIVVSITVLIVFAFTAAVFLLFNFIVERRQTLVMTQAVRSTALVTSLFPEGVRDRLMDQAQKDLMLSGKSRLQNFLTGDDAMTTTLTGSIGGGGFQRSAVIADLFPFCTVFFGDIAGFTAYSSTREPSQIFILLETIYQAFDVLAKKRGVFKVETIGDSYVAVSGLPSPDKRHALSMARFALDCLKTFKSLTKLLENTLGPDTSELGLRIGLHSGPVTAGVLRGERSRFQLFGDTVNTAARMESTGCTNRIQISHATAELLREEGKDNWIVDRTDAVHAKGKGVLATFWLQPNQETSPPSALGNFSETGLDLEVALARPEQIVLNQKSERLVNWVVDTFSKHLSKIIAHRSHEPDSMTNKDSLVYRLAPGKTSLDEVVEVIKMPMFNKKASARAKERRSVAIDDNVARQLKEVITRIEGLYNANPFHNFEHACHVSMAVDKFLSRIETPDIDLHAEVDAHGLASQIHDFTHGITSDPTTVLAIVFAALVHDADHRGVSNAQLAKEDVSMATLYHNQSIAEQHSLDRSWAILMDGQYHELRLAIFGNRADMLRFRQVFVNVVLATDIFDKQLNDLRKNRWDKAFNNDNGEIDSDLRATIVIEHIMQASDVAHTMQHWHIYRKWNERLFEEMHEAYQCGRMAKDPADFWYHGELGFFDNYIIPLARKLRECNVFGVSSDECLNYALANRSEWAHRGEDIVASLIESVTKKPPATRKLGGGDKRVSI